MGSFSEGLAAAASLDDSNYYGYIDKTGEYVIEPKFWGTLPLPGPVQESEDSTEFHDGYAIVHRPGIGGDEWVLLAYIDYDGNTLTPPGPVKRATIFSNGLAIVQTDIDTNIIDKSGQTIATVAECNHNNCGVGAFSEGLAKIERNRNARALTGFFDESGEVVIAEQFDDAQSFSEGMAAVYDFNKQLWGYIDRSGAFVIPYQFTMASRFSEGLAFVSLPDGNGGYIDKTGNIVLPLKATVIPDSNVTLPLFGGMFRDNLALVGNGYINKNGKFVYKIESSSWCP